MKSLFKLDSRGKIRVIEFWCEGNAFKQNSGVLDGKLVPNIKICKGKNIGKANETSGEEQAILEMESKIREKLQEDYFESVEEATTNSVMLPMLAKKYNDEKHKVTWENCYIQPKLDGQRCLAICNNGEVQLISRDGIDIQKKHGSMQHIISELSKIKENAILDGELYVHGETFQDVMRGIKKLSDKSLKISYHVYDTVSDKPFRNRTIRSYIKDLNHVKEVSTYAIANEKDLKTFHDGFISEGYEGSIIRWGESGYKINGRSDSLLKYKDFTDDDFLIVDVIPAENRPEWGMIVCKKEGNLFSATPKMSHDDKKDILINKNDYIGKTAIITYFGVSENDIPRFPIFKGCRLDNLK